MEFSQLCDVLNSFFQAYFFVLVTNKIPSKDNKLSNIKVNLLGIIIFTEIEIFTQFQMLTTIRLNPVIANISMVLLILVLMILFYRKSIIDAFVGFGVSYSYITLFSYVLLLFHKAVITDLNLKISNDKKTTIFIYIPVFISYYIFYKFRRQFINLGLYLKNLRHSIIIIQIIDYSLIFIAIIQVEWITSQLTLCVKAVLVAIAFTVYIFEAIYFARINDKSKELEFLNETLNDKITELRKIKHDYGSEISAIYGLYQLGKYDQLGKILNSVIERNQSTISTIQINDNKNPMITSLLNSAIDKNISVMVFDKANYEELTIGDNELVRLLSNIINNAIDALKIIENPIIKFYSYDNYDSINISIENNGPRIKIEDINKIFELGFTTKENVNNDRGFGLNIVKDIINKCKGKVLVESDNEWTKFKIKIPKK